MTQNSILIQFINALGSILSGFWPYSWTGRTLIRCGQAIRTEAEHSSFCQFCWRDGTLPQCWPHSFSCRLFTALINLPCALVKWIYKSGKQFWEGSCFFRLCSALGGVCFAFLGLFLLVMLVAPHAIWNNLYGLLGAAALTFLFILGSAMRPKRRLELDRLGPYMLLYMGWICYGLAASLSPALSVRFFFFHIASFLLVLLIVSSIRKYEQLQLLTALITAGITLAALYGCYQGYVGVEVIPSQQDMVVNAGMPGRVYSVFDNPNNFAELLAMLIPLELALFLNAKGWRGKLLAAAALIPCVAAIGFTYGRSSWIGLALAVVVFLAFQNWRLIPAFLVLGLCALPLLPQTIYNRILTIGNTKDSSTQYRFAIYKATGQLLSHFWYRGVGLGSDVMRNVFERYPPMSNGAYPIHTHNNYLQMWGEVGILGTATYLALLLHQLKLGVKTFLLAADQRVKNLLAASVSGFCAILLIGVAEYTWFYPRNMFLFWTLFGIIGSCIKLGRMNQEQQVP